VLWRVMCNSKLNNIALCTTPMCTTIEWITSSEEPNSRGSYNATPNGTTKQADTQRGDYVLGEVRARSGIDRSIDMNWGLYVLWLYRQWIGCAFG